MSPDNAAEREAVRSDPVRLRLRDLLRRNDLTLKAASLAIGRNGTYLHQYVDRGIPAVLGYRDSETLGEMLGCDPSELRHEAVPERRPMKRKPPRMPARLPGAPVAVIPEVTVEVSAGAGTFAEEFVSETALWQWPENMIRHEAGAAPENLRILRVRGNSMEPELRDGDRIVVDVSRRLPATGETFVLWDGIGLVVKRVEVAHGDAAADDDESARIRLISANPDYAPYTCLAQDAHILGKVLWAVRRT
ncbi:MAG: S24 family peptidase [Deltaproteobacteria bacterium]|nr:S24 family peptidase [Deltaproteobacteria bacterium]